MSQKLLLETPYPLVDKQGVEWRFEGARPVSSIADKTLNHLPCNATEDDLDHINKMLESDLFPDLTINSGILLL